MRRLTRSLAVAMRRHAGHGIGFQLARRGAAKAYERISWNSCAAFWILSSGGYGISYAIITGCLTPFTASLYLYRDTKNLLARPYSVFHLIFRFQVMSPFIAITEPTIAAMEIIMSLETEIMCAPVKMCSHL
jgi:hypothetical protein